MTEHLTYFKKHFWLFIIFSLLLSAIVLFSVGYLAEKNAVSVAKTKMRNTLEFQTVTLKETLDKYSLLAAQISKRPTVVETLKNNLPFLKIEREINLAQAMSGASGATNIWIVDRAGNVVVSNNESHLSLNVAQENYFLTAKEGRLGRDSQVVFSGKRYYVFASPVFGQQEVVGAVVLRVDLEFIEQVWAILVDPILVSNKSGLVLLSNISEWRLKSFAKNEYQASSKDNKQHNYLVENFVNKEKSRLLLNAFGDSSAAVQQLDYLQVSRFIELLGWRLHVMNSYDPIIKQRNNALIVALLCLMLLVMTAWMWVSRQQRLLEEKRSQQAFALRLERQVKQRTHELTLINERLGIEVEERKLVEKNLREAQEELIQTAKLAGIGQMSTALAHEYNQPLAAIRSYTDNALAFIDNDKVDTAVDNLHRINLLIDKMANLTKTVRNFAHRADTKLKRISLDEVMDELFILVSPQAKKQKVELMLMSSGETIYVMAERSRLSQVVTNLVTNAMDAVEHSEKRLVEVEWKVQDNKAVISVKDTGTGIDASIKENIFNAFFTTKETGDGLGLGLFIVLNIIKDFKGTLSIKEEPGYGAIFEILLPLAEINENT
jgi:two-component system C4-dicarboxylate transport sensor histidine kinase DctB